MGFAYTESFENGIPNGFDGDWIISEVKPHSGKYCLKSANINAGKSSQVIYTFNTSQEGIIKFFYRISTLQDYDKLACYIDDVFIDAYSGEVEWTEYSQSIAAGLHTLKFIYRKYSSNSGSEDSVYIDDIYIENLYYEITKSFDTQRRIKGTVELEKSFDSTRKIVKTSNVSYDTSRLITKTIKKEIDLKRKTKNFVNNEFPAKRTTKLMLEAGYDTKRTVCIFMNQSDITTASLTLSVNSFADRPYIETSNPKYLEFDSITGMIGNYPFSLSEPETTEEIGAESVRYSLTGRPDMTDALYRDVYFTVDNLKISTLLKAVNVKFNLPTDFTIEADSINAEWDYDSVKKKYLYAITCTSLKQFLTNLLDWSKTFYQKQMFCTYRDGGMYVTSLEQVKNVYHTDDFAVTDLSISKSKIRNMTEAADSSGNNTESDYKSKNNDTDEREVLISGTYQFGDSSVTYMGGLLVNEQSGNSQTKYSYVSLGNLSGSYSNVRNKYLSKKVTVNGSDSDVARVEVTYYHNIFAKEYYISKEIEVSYKFSEDKSGTYLASEKVTACVPLGNGHWGQRVETYEYSEDGSKSTNVTTSLSSSGTGQASLFSIKQTQRKHKTSTSTVHPDVTLPGRSATTLNCPIVETDTFTEYINLYAAMNGKKEVVLTATIISEKVIDVCNSAFEYRGDLYHIQSNAITKNSNSIRQRITAIRWY